MGEVGQRLDKLRGEMTKTASAKDTAGLEEVAAFFFFLAVPEACRISLTGPGMEPAPPAMEAWSLNSDRQGSPSLLLSAELSGKALQRR